LHDCNDIFTSLYYATLKSSYYAEYAAVQSTHWWYLARAEILETVLRQYLPADRSRRLLDLGCGPGGMRPMLSQFGRLVSTDFTFDALQFCQAQQLDDLVAADGMKLPFADASFDAVCMFDVIEHLSDDALAARELHRVLKPGGLAIVTVPAFQWLWGRQDIVSHHFRRYNARQLRSVLTGARFTVLKLSYFNTVLFPPVAAIRLTFQLLGLNRGKSAEDVSSDLQIARQGPVNTALRKLFTAEKVVLRSGNLPFGVSLLCVVRKGLTDAVGK
jgi:SAM-dependent methyltransferase